MLLLKNIVWIGLLSATCWHVVVAVKYPEASTKSRISELRSNVKKMFYHAYDGYMKYAYPLDELKPISCKGTDTWGSYSLTLIDALDTLLVLGNITEYRRVVELLTKQRKNFDSDINVSVFETNIRIVGGLLSAHLLAHRSGIELEPGWPCNGPLLRLAEDAARRLLPAFDTATGMPFGTVNLRHGVPHGETPVTCTAGVGTFVVEFGTLSRLTGDPVFEKVALRALNALWHHRSSIGLFGNHLNVQTGQWVAADAGIGAAVDSYYEYLVKGGILLQKPELMKMFNEGKKAVDKYLKHDDWYFWTTMSKGTVTLPVFQNLEAFWPGLLTLIGDLNSAKRTMLNYHRVLKQYGFVPEMYDVPTGEVRSQREGYPLRPEFVESLVYLYRATKNDMYLSMGEDVLRAIEHSAKTDCGYATIKDVKDHSLEDRMESFFLAETTKYLYLLFDPDNFLLNTGSSGKIHKTYAGSCVIDAGYIFNTEAHPIDISALNCCTGVSLETMGQYIWNNLIDISEPSKKSSLKGIKLSTMIRNRKANTEEETEVKKEKEMKTENKEGESIRTSNDSDPKTTPLSEKKFGKREPKELYSESSGTCRAQGFMTSFIQKPKNTCPVRSHVQVSSYSLSKKTIDTGTSERPRIIQREAPPPVQSQPSLVEILKQHDSLYAKVLRYGESLLIDPTVFDSQKLLKHIDSDVRYKLNQTWYSEYQVMRCDQPPFIEKFMAGNQVYKTVEKKP